MVVGMRGDLGGEGVASNYGYCADNVTSLLNIKCSNNSVCCNSYNT